MAQKKVRAAIVSQEKLAEGIFSMWLDAPEMAEASRPGQFIAVYTNDPSKLLPRPISICEADKEKGRLRIVYRIAGAGTLEFSRYQAGDTLDIMGPRAGGLKADVIYACGPTPMLKALKAYAAENGIECWISLEEKMACGIGACLGCVCHSKDVDEHSNVKNKRVCKDGPVFLADEVELLSSEEQRERIAGGCMCGTVKVKED